MRRLVPHDWSGRYPEVPGGESILVGVEANALASKGYALWITMGAGASENVLSDALVPHVQTVPSQGSGEGARCVAANGCSMPIRGKKAVETVSEEEHRCLLNMQVTDVKKSLMRVMRICDAGHSATFRKDGGAIPHIADGRETKSRGVGNVYRLQARAQTATRASTSKDSRVSVRDSGSRKSGSARSRV